jgi:hypothetical protein
VFFDTNVILDSDGLLRYAFRAAGNLEATFLGVICDFIEGEVRNLRQGLEILEEIKNPASLQYNGFYFKTTCDSYAGARRSLEDMPTPEMAEAVRVEYDKKLDTPPPKEVKKKRGDSKFGDFSLLTVATISAFRRKRQSIVVSRDRVGQTSLRFPRRNIPASNSLPRSSAFLSTGNCGSQFRKKVKIQPFPKANSIAFAFMLCDILSTL